MGPGEGAPELLVEHESSSGSRVIQVRGSLMVSSLQTLRELGHFERYLSHLPPEHRDSVLFALASSWLPVELAMVHYEACDTMELSTSELETIGQHVSTRIMGTFLGTLMRSSRQIGASTSPFVPLRQYHRLWDRLLMGGGCTVRTTGKKDASIESRGVPMFRYRYFRNAYAGLIRGAGLMFAKAVHMRLRQKGDEALFIDASWV